MSKHAILSAATTIVITTALAWGLPVQAQGQHTRGIETGAQMHATPSTQAQQAKLTAPDQG